MKKTKRYNKKKREKLYERVRLFINIMKGKEYYIRDDDDKHTFTVATGTRHFLKYMYSRGDCGRFALILYEAFLDYHPIIYYIHWPEEGYKHDVFHFVTRILDRFYDVYGELGWVHQVNDLKKLYKHPVTIDRVNSKWFKDPHHKDIILGNFPFHRFVIENITNNIFPEYWIQMNYEDPSNIKIKGYHHDKLTNIIKLFNDIKNGEISSVEEWNKEINSLNNIKYLGESYTK